jgi:hypothetical protein
MKRAGWESEPIWTFSITNTEPPLGFERQPLQPVVWFHTPITPCRLQAVTEIQSERRVTNTKRNGVHTATYPYSKVFGQQAYEPRKLETAMN